MTDAVKIVLAVNRAFPEPQTLLVDDLVNDFREDRFVACLSQAGLAPEEMWACHGAGSMKLVVLSAARSAREMFRVLSLVERLVAPDGKILILPVEDEVRPEATEIFCGIYPEWSRRQLDGNVVELRRDVFSLRDLEVAVKVDGSPIRAAIEKREPTFGLEAFSHPSKAAVGDKCVISLSVFGEPGVDGGYWRYLPTYIRAHYALFPGYELRIHHDDAIFQAPYGDVLFRLQRYGFVNLVHVPSRPGRGKCESMLHRLLPVWDPEVAYVFCRDVDALPTWRERCAVEEFIASGRDVGVIHDNREHGGLMGGLSHFNVRSLRNKYATFDMFIAEAGRTDEAWSIHGQDQLYLNEMMLEFSDVLEHSLRSRGVRTIMGSDFRTAIAEPSLKVIESVSETVREKSDSFINYMGAAGRHEEEARTFYDVHCPIIVAIREAEAGIA